MGTLWLGGGGGGVDCPQFYTDNRTFSTGNCRHAGAKAVPLGAGLLPATRGNLRLAEPVKSVFCLVITDFNPTEHLNLRLCPKCKSDCMDRVHIQTFGDISCVGPISIDVWERFG